jgi:hypothetical protein
LRKNCTPCNALVRLAEEPYLLRAPGPGALRAVVATAGGREAARRLRDGEQCVRGGENPSASPQSMRRGVTTATARCMQDAPSLMAPLPPPAGVVTATAGGRGAIAAAASVHLRSATKAKSHPSGPMLRSASSSRRS